MALLPFRPGASFQRRAAALWAAPAALAFWPAISLAAFWLGEAALITVSVVLPLAYFLSGGLRETPHVGRDAVSGLMQRPAFEKLTEVTFQSLHNTGHHSVVYYIALEDFDRVVERNGQAGADSIIQCTGERLLATLRADDYIGQMGDARFAICLNPVRRLDLETCIQTAARLQSALEDPFPLDGTTVHISAAIGFCQHARAPGTTSADWIAAAATALRAGQNSGPCAIRAYSDQMRRDAATRSSLLDDVAQALDCGQIKPWFQPQISTDTGQVTGFEALARWSHPTRGMIAPMEFLPAIEQANLLERLAEVMMYHAFTALKSWDNAGFRVPQVGVNFAGPELGNPQLVDKIKWEFDRFDLAPDRLAVEVLETVMAGAPADMVTRNINALRDLGCQIDLDDFGTGHASLTSIRRFSVSRIKIDRSFVKRADRDPEQQRMISAILTMAERLGVETLAEGVESVGEHVLLAQLGCNHVQGYGIARPMPFEQTLDWIANHNAKLEDVPQIMDGRSHR
ncbi:putative bifunctional diguanylate cyclase/phosphodiesterase [Sulfitobacter aestuariivivens]|uniref:putative bifunctional diguanylate cyclase/phosphodiesterase n=1 Tax=Sulfitobacter aestuariivivens TaxID=2766981 RepID=UPI00360668AF